MCLYPRLINNPKYKATKKNGGIIPPIMDERVLKVPVGCGKCMECLKQKARQWQVRLNEELRTTKNAQFVTLTFSNESITELTKELKLEGYELDNAIAILATRRFLERWRKKYKTSVRHWLVTELGKRGTENIHLHGIIFTDKPKEIESIWKYGYTYIGDYVTEKTINYIIKYILKTDPEHTQYTPKILTSAGIGAEYTNRTDARNNKYQVNKTNERYTTRTGIKLNLPIYYRNKIYTEEQREKLWLEKLDKQTRWVNGQKIEIKNGDLTNYEIALKNAQAKNERLGYGTAETQKTWERNAYENELRKINQQKRINGHNNKDGENAGGGGLSNA